MLRWLHSEGAPLELNTALGTAAAAEGHLDSLAWLRQVGCPWNTTTSTVAFCEGHLEVLSWLAQQLKPCPWAGLSGIYHAPAPDSIPNLFSSPSKPVRLLGQTLEAKSAVELQSLIPQNCIPGVERTYLPEHLQRVLTQRALAVAQSLDTTYIDSFLNDLLVRSKPWDIFYPLTRQVASTIIRFGLMHALEGLLQDIRCHESPTEDPDLSAAFSAGWDELCVAAAKAGEVEMLKRLIGKGSFQRPCSPVAAQSFFLRLLDTNNSRSIAWLFQEYPARFGSMLCTRAADNEDLEQLQILRSLQPPCPWGESVFMAAKQWCHVPMLQWMLNATPPFEDVPVDEAKADPLTIVATGHVETMQLIWPVKASPQQMYEAAAQYGQLRMLKWLHEQQPTEGPQKETARLALEHDHLDVVQHLLDCRPKIRFPRHLSNVPARCLVAMARAERPFTRSDKQRVSEFCHPWFVVLGLARWASRLQALAGPSFDEGLADQGGSRLLAQLARLPPVIVERIASQALLD